MPPLDYDLVARVKQENPNLTIVLNGGIETLGQVEQHLAHVDGVMLGRAAYHAPALLAEVDARLFGGTPVTLDAAVAHYRAYIARKPPQGRACCYAMTRHMLGLFNGRPGARQFRRHLSEHGHRPGAGLSTLDDALARMHAPSERAAA